MRVQGSFPKCSVGRLGAFELYCKTDLWSKNLKNWRNSVCIRYRLYAKGQVTYRKVNAKRQIDVYIITTPPPYLKRQ